MSRLLQNPLGKLLTLGAVALGYGLWTLSSKVEDWVAVPALLPVVRLGVLGLGLSLSDMIYRYLSGRLLSRISRDLNEGL